MKLKTFHRACFSDGHDLDVLITLSDVRKRRGLTQQELATMVGVSKNTISSIENYESYPSTKLLVQLAFALHCPLYMLVSCYDFNDGKIVRL